MSVEKNCFVIAPIGDPNSETRKRSDQILNHVIKHAVSKHGYKAVRADEIDKPGRITNQVIQHVVNAPLVIADLTEGNPNVFYELAIRHVIRKPYIQLMKMGEKLPFDVADLRTIYIDHKDLDSVEEAKNKIAEQIIELEKDTSDIETPISMSLDHQILKQSRKPEQRSIADLVSQLSTIRFDLQEIGAKIDNQFIQDSILIEEVTSLENHIKRIFNKSGSPPFLKSQKINPDFIEDSLQRVNSDSLKLLILVNFFRDVVPSVI